jgi:hypothetical protein
MAQPISEDGSEIENENETMWGMLEVGRLNPAGCAVPTWGIEGTKPSSRGRLKTVWTQRQTLRYISSD